ncbi:response regulator [Dethiosulfatarculus sandiegensis]|nr:response regulator [Dethiosulfatarculus sandiegensis]
MPFFLPQRDKNSTAVRIMRLVFVVYVLVTLLLTLVHMYLEYDDTRTRVFGQLKLLESTFNPALAGALWTVNEEQLISTIKGMLKNPILKGVKIEDKNQLNLLHGAGLVSNDKGEQFRIKNSRQIRVNHTKSWRNKPYSYSFDIRYREDGLDLVLGVCTVYSNASVVIDEVKLGFILIAINAVIKSIVFWLVYLFVSHKLLGRPLSQFTRAVRSLDLDNLEHFDFKIKSNLGEDLKFLKESFQLMVNKFLRARQRLVSNMDQLRLLSEQGRQISACASFEELADQISLSFSKLAGYPLRVHTFFHLPQDLTGLKQTRASEKTITKTGLHLELVDQAKNKLWAEIWIQDSMDQEKEKDLHPLFQALLINIANTVKNLITLGELDKKARDLEDSNLALSRLDKLKDDFLAKTSHELRTPINGIIGISQALLDGLGGPLSQKQSQNLTSIVTSGKSLSNLINDLLDFSKISNQVMTLWPGDVNLGAVVETSLTVIAPLARQRGLSLESQIPSDLPLVRADEGRLQQILANLLSNALKYTAEGKIIVSAKAEGEFVLISVSDTGIGIPREKQKLIFEPFEQHSPLIGVRNKGAGLGLAICKQLVELHHGLIEVESVEGIGSRFCFSLPKSKATQASVPSGGAATNLANRFVEVLPKRPSTTGPMPLSPENAQGETILVVEDEALNMEVVTNYLVMAGYRVLSALNGEEALMVTQKEKPDLILMDLMMPVMNGFESCRRIRAAHEFTFLPIIILTARNQVSDLVKGFEMGANDYVLKPFLKDELLARVDLHLKAKKAAQRLLKVKALEREIKQRKQVERQLKQSRQRLLDILDVADTALIALDKDLKISYFNQGAEKITALSHDQVLYQDLSMIFDQPSSAKIKEQMLWFGRQSAFGQVVHLEISLKKETQTGLNRRPVYSGSVSLVRTGGEDMLAVFLPFYSQSLSPGKDQALKGALDQVGEILGDSDTEFIRKVKQFSHTFQLPGRFWENKGKGPLNRSLLTEIMTASLALWEEETGKTKIDLALESGLWKAYLDSGTYRTRTLDKYLAPKTLPKNPKWRDVLATALFVLNISANNSAFTEPVQKSLTRFMEMSQRADQ